MARKRTKKAKVEYILQNYPATRINDRLLVTTYWRHFDNIKSVDDCVNATSSETITRIKRKLNENGKYMVTDGERKKLIAEEFAKAVEFKAKQSENAYDDGLISIKPPTIRKTVYVDSVKRDLSLIDDLKMVAGVYVFYDAFSNPLYVGITGSLYHRTNTHIIGISSNHRLKELMRNDLVHRVDYMYVSNVFHRDIYETYLIKALNPFCNTGKTIRKPRANENVIQEYKRHINEKAVA
ncbi:GIY-YIG nuclease family protein [Bacillus mycoides]|uniref:Excinuclease ABC C subunit domain protein n=1 Tax=Bacillus mycoides (strain KBAB4) TaxID=315730 RepID=A9VVN2_BACMK|nr:GIY-YIG nuclease family protein [Bacillus mycoides]ABY46847.1 Excinuclease ABC C subunit domain protein [Bacillus mycoides KBAB4]